MFEEFESFCCWL